VSRQRRSMHMLTSLTARDGQRYHRVRTEHLRGNVMRLSIFLLSLAAMPAIFAQAANAEGAAPAASGAVYIATYLETMPNAAKEGAALLKQYREASAKDNGNQDFIVVQERGRPNRFVVLQIWKDQAAFDAHSKTAHTAQFRDKLKAIQITPYDERVHSGFNVQPSTEVRARRAVYVVSHVDVPPPRKGECEALLNDLSTASRKDAGNIWFGVGQQTSRPNHFTVVEVWKDKKSYDAHVAGAATKQFREKLTPMSGALYDERLYKVAE
jgi:quinol monooxygenase YgiN